MPCFKGLAVSIHTPDGPLPEYSIQRVSRLGRISSYIAVPPPKIPASSSSQKTKPEQSTFAISITLLTPGLNVPYSSPKPTTEHPYPQPIKVGSLSGASAERGRVTTTIFPYMPLTTSPNETIAAYIYFDGRPKEEVATLLRRGEETWVNSRWVSVPESEGGGLAEREFLFREVGLERWLNGLDLEGKDNAAKIEKRRVKLEKKRRRRKIKTENSDDEDELKQPFRSRQRDGKGVLRYGADDQSPLEHVSDTDEMTFSDTDDSDDDPVPESTGQIKVALYRVLASGDIRRGEYSPQFEAHEGDDDVDRMEGDSGSREEVDHTTGFAKPKTLDPKTISTQTVTGIDPQERPFAVFTFWYRGEKQLQKMNILPNKTKATPKTPVSNGKRGSIQDDFSKFKPLDSDNLRKFSQMRDPAETNGVKSSKAGKKRNQEADDSDEELDDHDVTADDTANDKEKDADAMLSPEDARRQGELADGVQKIRLKRQHSAEDVAPSPAPANRQTPPTTTTSSRASPTLTATPAPHALATPGQPKHSHQDSSGPLLPSVAFNSGLPAQSTTTAADAVGSPLKKARSSISGMGVDVGDEEMRRRFGLFSTPGKADGDVVGTGASSSQTASAGPGLGLSGIGPRADVLGNIEHDRFAHAGNEEGGSNQARNIGGLLGGILTKGGGASNGGNNVGPTPNLTGAESKGADVKNEPVQKEVKMEEEEEL